MLFNPAGTDAPLEYVEIRGIPNHPILEGTFLLTVEGDAGGNPGTIQNLFDLGGQRVGGNGFLVILQKESPHRVASAATLLINTDDGPGWGSGSSSSIKHSGEDDQTDIENPSTTFLLVHSSEAPKVGKDIDEDDDGIPDGELAAIWTVLDSIAILDADGVSDISFGAISFVRETERLGGPPANGNVVALDFTPGYVARVGHTIGSRVADWVVSDHPVGDVSDCQVGDPDSSFPPEAATWRLDHLGGANFGAPALPGVVLELSGEEIAVSEDGLLDTYQVQLNSTPQGKVVLRIQCPPPLAVSVDGGATFRDVLLLSLGDSGPREILVRAENDQLPNLPSYVRSIQHQVVATQDPAAYPIETVIPPVPVRVTENDRLVLSEVKVNPPGGEDAPFEFIELRGTPDLALADVYLLALDGDSDGDPGTVEYRLDLTPNHLGANGLLLVAAPNNGLAVPVETTVVEEPRFTESSGALSNGSLTLLLVSSPTEISLGEDLDKGDNGKLEGLPRDATILDAVGWSDGGNKDHVFSDADLDLKGGTPDAAARFPGVDAPDTEAAWFFGELAGDQARSVSFDPGFVSENFRAGTLLTPGDANNTAPAIQFQNPVSGVIGDPTNPPFSFSVSDDESGVAAVSAAVTSSDQNILPDGGLTLLSPAPGSYSVHLEPTGVGYCEVVIAASDGSTTNRLSIPYAASAMGRPNGVWHLGASDASTAIPLDADWMWVADDEDEALRLFSRERSSTPLEAIDFAPFLDLPDVEDGQLREVDLEASVRVGNRLFWLGSHSHANIGEVRTNRTRLFATDLVGEGPTSTLNYVGRYDYLKQDLIAWDQLGQHGQGVNYLGLADSDAEGVLPKAPDGSGWSIEGLAMMPESTQAAYVAFRAPIVPPSNRDHALIVPVLNFVDLAVSDGPPGAAVFGPPVELNLYGRGIRSLESNEHGYLIIAGPAAANPGPYPHDFRLYTWSGNPADAPDLRSTELRGLNPEGIVELPQAPWTAASQAQLISDNGQSRFYGDDTPAKLLPIPNFKKSRSDVVTLGEIVPPAPVLIAITAGEAGLQVTWRSLAGLSYRLEGTENLPDPTWTPLGLPIPATGSRTLTTIPFAGFARQFVRVVLSQP